MRQDTDLRGQILDACRSAAQIWPLRTFAYRNPLRGFEFLPFDDAVREASATIGGRGYLSNGEFREFWRQGRIREESLRIALHRLGPSLNGPPVQVGDRALSPREVAWASLTVGVEPLDHSLLQWNVRRDGRAELLEAVEAACLQLDDEPESILSGDLPASQTLGDWLDRSLGTSILESVDGQMIKWMAAFLDEGLAGWHMPGRAGGFYSSWRILARVDPGHRLAGISGAAAKIDALPESPTESVQRSLGELGIPEDRWFDYQTRAFAQLPGWTGFLRWRSENPTYPAQAEHPADVVEYLAVRLFYETEFVRAACAQRGHASGPLLSLVQTCVQAADPQESSRTSGPVGELYALATALDLAPAEVRSLSAEGARTLLGYAHSLPEEHQGPIWLEAYEDSFRFRFLRRFSAHQPPDASDGERPAAQMIFCIDARSEPFRRHLEAQGNYETFGYAGFFGVPINHQAFDSEDRLALCPVLLKPPKTVNEAVRGGQEDALRAYASGTRWRRLRDTLFHDLKQSPFGAFVLVDAVGVLFSIGLLGRTLAQSAYGRLLGWIRGRFDGGVQTHVSADPSDVPIEPPVGFTLEEQAAMVGGGLRMIGLTSRLGRIVVACGHGAESENNPYAAAYNCGACGGAHGDPNARAFVGMANDPRVRRILAQRGQAIPEDVWFVAGKHDTTTDRVTFYDRHDVPTSHRGDLRALERDLAVVTGRQAAERLRRIPGAPGPLNPRGAALHALSRSFDWANPRPEWGLSSNAAFLIGRRARTLGLDLDSRVFLHSYDPIADTEGEDLEKIMTAPLIVGEWINTEYYFSAVSPWTYGSGSKVIHNVVGGVGVMLGSQSDLRGGLPVQGVIDGQRRYHEPMRLLAIIEAPTERISAIISKHEILQTLFHNQWVNLVALDPMAPRFQRYHTDATWEPLDFSEAA